MISIPDVNLMRETAEGITSEFRDEFAKSDLFKQMCEVIQEKANTGDFAVTFDKQFYSGYKTLKAAQELFLKGGYQTRLNNFYLMVSWGRVYEEDEQK